MLLFDSLEVAKRPAASARAEGKDCSRSGRVPIDEGTEMLGSEVQLIGELLLRHPPPFG